MPQHIVCLLHRADFPVQALLEQFPDFEPDAEYSTTEPDDRMAEAFARVRDRVHSTFTEADTQAVSAHEAVSYFLSRPFSATEAPAVSQRALQLVAAALQHGALAAKSESAGIAHGRAHWLALHAELTSDPAKALCRAWVRWPIGDEGICYSCGMHLLGLPDVEVLVHGLPEPQMLAVLQSALTYLIRQRPESLPQGKASLSSNSAQRCLLAPAPCERYEPEDFYYNPRGYWRATPLDAHDQPLPQPTLPVFDRDSVAVFCRFDGDEDGYARMASAEDRQRLSPQAMSALSVLLQDVALLLRGQATAAFARDIERRWQQQVPDADDRARLAKLVAPPEPSLEDSLRQIAAAIRQNQQANGQPPSLAAHRLVLFEYFAQQVGQGGFGQLLYNLKGEHLQDIDAMLEAVGAAVAFDHYLRAIRLCLADGADYESFIGNPYTDAHPLKHPLQILSVQYFQTGTALMSEAENGLRQLLLEALQGLQPSADR